MRHSSFPLLLVLVMATSVFAQQAQQDGDTTTLFNGKDLSGWKGNMDLWSVEDGAITGRTTSDTALSHNTFLVWEGGEPSDFELQLKFRIVGGNSGVQYRSQLLDEEKFIVGGYQADIDSSPRFSGINYDERGRAILAERGQKVTIGADGKKEVEQFASADELQEVIKPEQWNDYRIVARGNHLQHIINGELMSEVIDNQEEKAAKKGIIALQLHAGPPMTVQFKDLQLRQQPSSDGKIR